MADSDTTQVAAPLAPESETPAGPTVADLTARLTTERQGREKAENDLKAEKGRNRPWDALDARISALQADMSDRFDVQHKNFRALFADDPDERAKAREEAEKTDAEYQGRRSGRTLIERANRVATAIGEALLDEEGNSILSPEAPELANMRTLWAQGTAKNVIDLGILADALDEANRVVRAVERKRAKEAREAAATEGEQKGRAAEKAAVLRLANASIGSGNAGGGGGKRQVTRAELAAMSPEEWVKVRDQVLR